VPLGFIDDCSLKVLSSRVRGPDTFPISVSTFIASIQGLSSLHSLPGNVWVKCPISGAFRNVGITGIRFFDLVVVEKSVL